MFSGLGLTTAVCFPERLCSHIGNVNENGDVQPHKDKTVHSQVKGSGDKAEKQTTNRRSKSTGPKLGVSDGSQTCEEKLDKESATHLEQGVGETEKSICELTVVVEEDQSSNNSAEKPNFKVARVLQSGGTLSKLPKASRIPRTKSFNEGKSKCETFFNASWKVLYIIYFQIH